MEGTTPTSRAVVRVAYHRYIHMTMEFSICFNESKLEAHE